MQHRALLAIILIGLIMRTGYAIAIYEPSLLVYHGGDYELYRQGAEDILRGDLGFTSDLYLVRPPLFPLLMAVLGLQPTAILAVNILLSIGIIPLTFILACKFNVSCNAALLAALLVAIDPTSIKYAAILLAEPLTNLLLACTFVSAMLLRHADEQNKAAVAGLITGSLIALSALARPAAYLFWIPIAIWIAFAKRRWRLISAGAVVVAGLAGTGTWISHNYFNYGHASFTTIGNYNLLYYRAASVLHQASGLGIDEVYGELARRVEGGLGNDTSGITAMRRHYHYTGSPALQAAMRDVAIRIFFDHPLVYLATIPVGLYRVLIHVDGQLLLPGVIWNLALLIAALVGVSRLIRQQRWIDMMFLIFPCAYFVLGTLLVQTSGIDTRARVMVTPLLAIMAAYGVMHLLNRRRAASASLSPPACS